MGRKITTESLKSFLKCKYKSYLQLAGKEGISSDFERMLRSSRPHFKGEAIKKVIANISESDVLYNLSLTNNVLQLGAKYLINGVANYKHFSLLLDGMKKVTEKYNAEAFYYIPILFIQSNKINASEKHLLRLLGLILADMQGKQLNKGIIIHGQKLNRTTLNLNTNLRENRNRLEEIKEIQQGLEPQFIRNKNCHICEFNQRCLQKALKEDSLSLLRGMTEKQIDKYNRRGIFTVTQLSYTYRAIKKQKSLKKTIHQRDFALQALAIRDNRVFITEFPVLKHNSVKIFFDIEGIPDRTFNYLIGVLICTQNLKKRYSFWADDISQEIVILENFLNLVDTFEHFHIFHYGAYDVNFLKRMREKTKLTGIIDKLLLNSTNVLSLIYGRIFFPLHANSLKDIANFLGFNWQDHNASGINSIVWRQEWEENNSNDKKNRIIKYNIDDCTALKVVTDFIYSIDKTYSTSDNKNSIQIEDIHISKIIDKSPSYNHSDWGDPKFKISDFDYINKCSYFDYQREKIYVRTNKCLAKQQAKKETRPRKNHIRSTNKFEIKCSTCLICGSNDLIKSSRGPYRRKCTDLKLTKNGVKRQITEFLSYKYQCKKCKNNFFPEKYITMLKYGHTLKSWAMYEYVVHRMTFKGLEETFRNLFNLPVFFRHIHVFKRIMAEYYSNTVEGIRNRLVNGSILHADETTVKLQRVGKGYVWVFTSNSQYSLNVLNTL